MKYCTDCGHELVLKSCDLDGLIPYCEYCKKFCYPTFNSAISAILLNPNLTKALVIQQYGMPYNVLVAGYIMKGENAKETLIREVKEETNLNVKKYIYNDNEYYSRTNTLMHNYIAVVDSEQFLLNHEVDTAMWLDVDDVSNKMKPGSLAKKFYDVFYEKYQKKVYKFLEG